ncbi:hypothetical protein RJ639_036345 [Escallonia herrerae]|uniref:DUF4283 domain-containing protein n=1 Tax=Escallonia herrerae TaxID=1293975 RepID=A0AA88WSD1_9ASTE|nr:hypothetical protein RJ639_036345 [Escallonia herrerae]
MDIIINQTQSLLCEDYLDLDADDSNAAKESALTFVAKVISPKKINAKLAYSILLKAWNLSKGMQVKHQEDNVFSISFNHEWDRKRILDTRPDELEFHHSPFWIRIYGLPPNQMTKSNAERIGARIGELKDIDFTADGNFAWCKFLRIQVVLDIRQPIHTELAMFTRDARKCHYRSQKPKPTRMALGFGQIFLDPSLTQLNRIPKPCRKNKPISNIQTDEPISC